jgi:hypothetical protein
MSEKELEVFENLNLQSEESNHDVWLPAGNHVEELHPQATVDLMRKIRALTPANATSPRGLVVQGEKGTGKTHFVRYSRERFCSEEVRGWFVLIELTSAQNFWQDAARGMVGSLLKESQGRNLLLRLSDLTDAAEGMREAVSNGRAPDRDLLDLFVSGLRERDFDVGIQASDTARALALLAADHDRKAQDAGRHYFYQLPETEPLLPESGVRNLHPSWQDLVRELSMLMALTGPTLLAVDQIDTLLARSRRATTQDSGRDRRALAAQTEVLRPVADGLMQLRETTTRSVTLLCCLPATWEEIRTQTLATVRDRFETMAPLTHTLPSAEVAQTLVERHLSERYRDLGFEPPYPTWPVRPEAFPAATAYTARDLLQKISDHVRNCLYDRQVTELLDLDAVPPPEEYVTRRKPPQRRDRALIDLDSRWKAELTEPDSLATLPPDAQDDELGARLLAGLECLLVEKTGIKARVEPLSGKRPALHARLRLVLVDADEDELHWSLRALPHAAYQSVQAILPLALNESGIKPADRTRNLAIIRNTPWPRGYKTQEMVAEFGSAGGRKYQVGDADLQILRVLRNLRRDQPAQLDRWLTERRPAHEVGLFEEILGENWPQPHLLGTGRAPVRHTIDLTSPPSDHKSAARSSAPPDDPGPSPPLVERSKTVTPGGVTIGFAHGGEALPFTIPLEQLRKHLLVVAGSGAGKTVLLKRLVEEAALQGISSVVLDPNNDLSRLGDPWPQPPADWLPGDDLRARRYFETTEVLIWTPRRNAGLPLTFEPIPDLGAFQSDPDEFEAVVQGTVSTLAPRANLKGTTQKALVSRAVLTEALRFHGRSAETGLDSLINLLEDLPEVATTFEDGPELARSLAVTLRAARVTDPLFAGTGPRTSPADLLTPSPGKRARISVISFVGLPQPEQRQSFVSQLQLALFSWIRRNPADGPLGGLLVMDEAQDFAPAIGHTPSSASTLQLAAQARKFGLGLAFATQAPRGLHNMVSGNTATQFIGRLTHPTQIDAAEQLARARRSTIPDVAGLGAGHFYAGTEGTGLRRITVPLSLSHHPPSPPTEEEIIRLAADRRPS